MEKAFTNIYAKNKWGNGSGSGSKMSLDNRKYIELLQEIMNDYDIKTICDVGCGDWQFAKYIDWGDREYLGIDCVESVIKTNIIEYQTEKIHFQHKTMGEGYMPEGYDLVIIKDVIQHWEDKDILAYLEPVLKTNKYVFLTNGYKFMRDKSKNELETRDINNPYRYHPVSIDKYPLNALSYTCHLKRERRAKQMLLLSQVKA